MHVTECVSDSSQSFVSVWHCVWRPESQHCCVITVHCCFTQSTVHLCTSSLRFLPSYVNIGSVSLSSDPHIHIYMPLLHVNVGKIACYSPLLFARGAFLYSSISPPRQGCMYCQAWHTLNAFNIACRGLHASGCKECCFVAYMHALDFYTWDGLSYCV